jgi:hypothetical protein
MWDRRQSSDSPKKAATPGDKPAHAHRRRDGGGDGHGGHEGMEEMGIMTTNFAWEKPVTPVKRSVWLSTLFNLPG